MDFHDSAIAEITFDDFLKVDMRVGTIITVEDNLKAKKPAYILTIDFGNLGQKMSSAQITDRYSKAELIGKQIIAVVNFPPKKVAGVKSEVLILGAVPNDRGVVLLEPNLSIENGTRIS